MYKYVDGASLVERVAIFCFYFFVTGLNNSVPRYKNAYYPARI
jgi:hypothetical protein